MCKDHDSRGSVPPSENSNAILPPASKRANNEIDVPKLEPLCSKRMAEAELASDNVVRMCDAIARKTRERAERRRRQSAQTRLAEQTRYMVEFAPGSEYEGERFTSLFRSRDEAEQVADKLAAEMGELLQVTVFFGHVEINFIDGGEVMA
jgi:hypothetical protein